MPPGDSMLRFALHRQGLNSQVATRCYGMSRRGSLPNSVALGDRTTVRTLSPSTDTRKGLLPALNNQVSTLGVR